MVASEDTAPRYFTRGRFSRGRGLRNTNGCLTCRRRHVKCDEKKPVCGGCERNEHACAYVPRRPPVRKQANSGNESYDQDDNNTAPQEGSFPRRSSGSKPPALLATAEHTDRVSWPTSTAEDQPRTDTAEVSSDLPLDVGENSAVSPDFGVPDISNTQQESPALNLAEPCSTVTPHASATTSSSYGANLENATAIWVDLLLQDAALQEFDFTEFNIDTEGIDIFGSSVVQSPAVRKAVSHRPEDASSPTPLTSNTYLQERTSCLTDYQDFEKQSWYSKDLLIILHNEHVVFQNFVQHISQWMDFFDPKRPFGTLVPQLAMHNVGLMNAILALSARHLSIKAEAGAESYQDPNGALRYYYKTLHYIQEAMRYDSYKTSLELLATTSIISAYEMLDGSRQDWERHLKGVFWIQRSQVIHGDSLGLKSAVWWHWLTQDVWAAFREKRRPFTFWRPMKTLDGMDPYELASRSVYFFAQVVAFCSHEDTEAGKNDPLARIAAAETLKDMLESWRRYLTVEFQPLPYASSAGDAFEPIWIHSPSFAVAFQVYYCAHILLLLHVPVLGGLEQYTRQRKRLMECVKKVCGIGMTLSDYPSSVMCSQCLYIAGIPLEDDKERACVLGLLEACRQRSGWPVKPLGEELKARWEIAEAT